MKQKNVVIGATYLTRIGEELARVVVVHEIPGRPESHFRDERRTSYRIKRQGEETWLPKRRSAAALRED